MGQLGVDALHAGGPEQLLVREVAVRDCGEVKACEVEDDVEEVVQGGPNQVIGADCCPKDALSE